MATVEPSISWLRRAIRFDQRPSSRKVHCIIRKETKKILIYGSPPVGKTGTPESRSKKQLFVK
jgi:hypothetical protein